MPEESSNHLRKSGGSAATGGALRAELVAHLPFSVSSVALGLIIAGLICVFTDSTLSAAPEPHHRDAGHGPEIVFFHLFHPAHMFFSAAATTAMFWRYDRRAAKAVIIGLIGAIGVCGVSDIAMPHLSLLLLGRDVPLHLCVVDHPGLVLPFAGVGVAVGIAAAVGVEQSTLFSHGLHVFSSTMASIFYLIRPYESLAWVASMGTMFLFAIIAVMVPCCLSDIVFPLCLTKNAQRNFANALRNH